MNIRARRWLLVVPVSLLAACGHDAAARSPDQRSDPAGTSSSPVAVETSSPDEPIAPTTLAAPEPTAAPTTLLPPPTQRAPETAPTTTAPAPTPEGRDDQPPPVVDGDVLAGISMTSVPPDVIVPTSETSLDPSTNPINGRRSFRRPAADELACTADAPEGCLLGTLDSLGLDVTSGPAGDRDRRVQRALAVVQLDAGLPETGVPDGALLEYLGLTHESALEARAHEVRRIGTSAEGRPIIALRYGDGPRTVLVVGQTHGDEEGGLRVLLRARSLRVPDGVTLWVVPTMNPDGSIADTRALANGTNPNRQAPTQPEQLAVHELALDVRPSLTVWYHQNYGWVGGSGASYGPAARYHELTALGTLNRSGDCAKGFMWCPIDDALGSSSILVELPDVLTPADVQQHAAALLTVAAEQPVI